MIIGLSGTGKTTTTFTTQNDSLPVQDDFVALMPGGKAVRDRERMLRQDVQPRPRLRAEHLQRGRQAHHVPGERVPGRPRQGELLRGELHAERPRGVRDGRPRPVSATRREVGTVDYLLILNRNENIIPAVARLDQEQAAAYFMLGETTGTSRRRRGGGGQVPPGPGHEPVLPPAPRTAGQPDPRAARDAPDRDLPAQHRPGRRRRRRRALEEGEDPAHVRVREGDRRARRSRGPRTTTSATRSPRPSRTSTTSSCCSRAGCTSARAGCRSTASRRAAEGGARRAPRGVPRALARDRQGRRLAVSGGSLGRRSVAPRNQPASSCIAARTSGTIRYQRNRSSSSSAARPWTSIDA